MRPSAVLINGACGGLVDERALAEAGRSGWLRAAAVDVYSVEPPPADHPLLGLLNVLHTPHLGGSTAEAQANVSVEAVDGGGRGAAGTAGGGVVDVGRTARRGQGGWQVRWRPTDQSVAAVRITSGRPRVAGRCRCCPPIPS
ncbi:MAG: hypothetical protein IPG72_07225 [Ardenticatenales bacterium]|nr:hypothetical protein [Ardenticatenales bacterium]